MKFTIIAAMDKNRGIGINGKLPWHLSTDLKHFARTTKGGTVIMGRKTWESIPDRYRPFNERLNIVVTRNREYSVDEGILLAHSLEEALEKAKDTAFVIGGATIYAEAIKHPNCERLILTELDATFDCDVFFPELPSYFCKQKGEEKHEEDGVKFSFVTYILEPVL